MTPNPCQLTECQGKPRCKRCIAWDAMDAPSPSPAVREALAPRREMPAYGTVPWQALIDAVSEAQIGRPGLWKPQEDCYVGHAPVSMNMNSLNRIVSMFALSAPSVPPVGEADCVEAERLACIFNNHMEDSHDIKDAAALLLRIAALRSSAPVQEGREPVSDPDAVRYRWLRQRPQMMVVFGRTYHNKDLDEAIDAALQYDAAQPPGEQP